MDAHGATRKTSGRILAVAATLAVLALAPGLTPTATAGIHNVQSILATEAEEGLSGALTGSADWRTGNVEFLFLSATPLARYRAGDHQIIGIFRAERRSSGDVILVSRLFEHLRYRYELTDRVLVEAFGQHEFDGQRRLKLRALGGGGARVQVLQAKRYGVGVGVAYMFEYERLNDDMAAADSGEDDIAHRASSYIVGHYQLDDRLQLIETLYVQPRLTDASDVRLLNESGITVSVTRSVSFTTAFTLAFDNETPDGIEELDTALKSSVTISF